MISSIDAHESHMKVALGGLVFFSFVFLFWLLFLVYFVFGLPAVKFHFLSNWYVKAGLFSLKLDVDLKQLEI